jgi:GTP-binding protein
MEIKTADFICSNQDYKKCPLEGKPEIAFIGRSNVGKSSLINMLSNRKNLAKTSSTPGKTRLINHFLINNHYYWVDLPGYGWAKLSKTEKAKLEKMVRDFILNREYLFCVAVLIDSRLEPQKIDLEFLRWLGENQIPLIIIFTKTDKNSLNQTNTSIETFNKELLKEWEVLPPVFRTSAMSREGKEELLTYLASIVKDRA